MKEKKLTIKNLYRGDDGNLYDKATGKKYKGRDIFKKLMTRGADGKATPTIQS